ncbi:monocarboxylate transporter 5-like [Patiria miniata]|uniref:Uncharacterized protein n=1 Tax=Patiria miniata TaxID=46514 RepID=A0A913Z9J9_PATMI|nr:monocarboxylate transporter 5-like [Patiria miniata]
MAGHDHKPVRHNHPGEPTKGKGEEFLHRTQTSLCIHAQSDPGQKSSDLIRLLRNPSFLVLMAVSIAHGFGWASTTYHLVSRAESINIEPDNAALLLTLMGAGSLIGRLSIGWIVDRNWMRPELYYTLSFGVCALATFITPLITEFKVLVAVALVHGISNGVASVVITMTPRLVVKPSLASTSMAYFFLAWALVKYLEEL